MHRDAGELERFDRVIANPPFSQNYSRSNMEFPERFHWGWAPTTGKKGDLMFAQHMLAVCKPGGMVVTVMPHGVLFRSGAEKEIRKKFLQEDLIEAVIGLPQNLFYGASIPACLLVVRPNLTGQSTNPNKVAARRGQVLFINADAEFYAGRAQNYLRPEHVEKIVSTFERFEDVRAYARVVSLAEIGSTANDFNLNITRYVDNSPPPEPHDVRAHLLGGVPLAEVNGNAPLFEAVGFSPDQAFARRDKDPQYFDFAPGLAERAAVRPIVETDTGMQTRHALIRKQLAEWWAEHSPRLVDLPKRRDLNRVRADFLDTFVTALSESAAGEKLPTLDRFKLAGVIAAWWTETLADFKTLLENGFPGVVDGWVDAIADAVEDDEAAGPTFDPFGHKLVRRTMADYLERIAMTKAEIERLKSKKESFEQSNAAEELDDEELVEWNYAKDLERQMRELKVEHKDDLKTLNKLEKVAAKTRATAEEKRAAVETKATLQSVIDHLSALEGELGPYEQIKQELSEVRAQYRALTNAFVNELKTRCDAMNEHQKRCLVLELLAHDVQIGLDGAVVEKRQELVRFIEGLWDKYRVTLRSIREGREHVEARLNEALRALRYD
jgi:type I restriction enzyme M protein